LPRVEVEVSKSVVLCQREGGYVMGWWVVLDEWNSRSSCKSVWPRSPYRVSVVCLVRWWTSGCEPLHPHRLPHHILDSPLRWLCV
jgi:hypothetical protein